MLKSKKVVRDQYWELRDNFLRIQNGDTIALNQLFLRIKCHTGWGQENDLYLDKNPESSNTFWRENR